MTHGHKNKDIIGLQETKKKKKEMWGEWGGSIPKIIQ